MDILSILQLLGGIGIFLYGLSNMSSNLEKVTGSGLEKLLEKLTTSKKKGVGRIKGWSFGAAITAIIQSSAATTIMLVGFVNADIMNVGQALPVVFGSNLGSTVTAQILRLGDIGSDNILVSLLKPSAFACVLVGIGAFIIVFSKNKKSKNVAGILVGLGMLFYGMTLMENALAPLKDNATFQHMFTSFENPLLGILIGLVITVILQSSNASVGILQTLSVTGVISYGVAIPIIIGENIGKCSTTIIGGIGANRKAKRLVVGYVFFNLFGAILFSVVIYGIHYTIGLPFMSQLINRSGIATIHLLFNLITSLVLLPFSDKISKLTAKIVGDVEEEDLQDKELAKLDDMLLNTPTVALEQCKQLITKMGEAITENYKIATSMLYDYDESKFSTLEANEAFIDKCETVLSSYVIRIDRKRLTRDNKLVVSEILNSISDFERMGDYCMNIAYNAQSKNEQNIHFTPDGHREAVTIAKAVEYTIDTLLEAFTNDDPALAVRVEPLADIVDNLKELIKSHHVDRLQDGICSIEGGVSLFDLLVSFERIASHASNISLHIMKRVGGDRDFDEMHGHTNDVSSEEYKALYHYYEMQYIEPIKVPLTDEERAEYLRNEKHPATGTEQLAGETAAEAEKREKAEEKAKKKEVKKAVKKTAKKKDEPKKSDKKEEPKKKTSQEDESKKIKKEK